MTLYQFEILPNDAAGCEVCHGESACDARLEAAHLVARCELRALSTEEAITRAATLHGRRTTAPLCRMCHVTFDRWIGVQLGGMVYPYTFWYARHQGAFKRLRAEREALYEVLTS